MCTCCWFMIHSGNNIRTTAWAYYSRWFWSDCWSNWKINRILKKKFHSNWNPQLKIINHSKFVVVFLSIFCAIFNKSLVSLYLWLDAHGICVYVWKIEKIHLQLLHHIRCIETDMKMHLVMFRVRQRKTSNGKTKTEISRVNWWFIHYSNDSIFDLCYRPYLSYVLKVFKINSGLISCMDGQE